MNIAYDPITNAILAKGDNVSNVGGSVIYNVDPNIDLSLYTINNRTLVLNKDAVWTRVRSQRNNLLSITDWTQLQDSSVDVVKWGKYRQALRDLPQNFEDPTKIEWPQEPTTNAKDTLVIKSSASIRF